MTPDAAEAYVAAGAHARTLSAWRSSPISHYEAASALGHPVALGPSDEVIGDLHVLRGAYHDRPSRPTPPLRRLTDDVEGPRGAFSSTSRRRATSAAANGSWPIATTRRRSTSAPSEATVARAATEAASPGVAARPTGRGSSDSKRSHWRKPPVLDAAAAQANNILGLLGCGREYLERSIELRAGRAAPRAIRIAALNNLARDHAAAGELVAAPRSSPTRRLPSAKPRATSTTRQRFATTRAASCTAPVPAMRRWPSSNSR